MTNSTSVFIFIRTGILAFLSFALSTTTLAQVSISCPADIIESNDPGLCEAVVNFVPPVGTGSGTGITTVLSQGLPPGSSFPVGNTSITYTVTNNEGDSDDCTFLVTVNDNEDPVFDCPGDIFVDADFGTCTATVVFDIPDATDNCSLASVVQIGGLPSGSSFPVGENNLDFRATDSSGNQAFCRIKIFVEDITPPVINCPADINLNVFNTCDTIVNYIAPVGVDACLPSSTVLTSGIGSGGTFPVGTTTEIYTVTDLDGNSAQCSFTVNIVDGAPPEITCPSDIIVNADPGDCDALVSFVTPSAIDNCPGTTVSQTAGLPSESAFPTGVNEVTFTATDASGNSASCTFTVTVLEETDPEITCPADIIANVDLGFCGAVVNYTPPNGTDDCAGANTVLISGLGPGGFFPVGTTEETYSVTDASGNTAECTFSITVLDSESPVINCPADILASADPGTCEALVNFPDAIATDNCPGLVVNQSSGPASGSAFPVGNTVIEFTAEDQAGNIALCSFSITVTDDEAPQIICPGDISLAIPDGNCTAVLNYPDPTVLDNCPGAGFSVVSGPSSGDIVSVGEYIIELQAFDAAGNTSICSFNVSISETSIPVFDCPSDLIVAADGGECSAVVTFSPPSAQDSCSAVTVVQSAGPNSGTSFPVGTNPVEFTATDEYGNSATCSFNIIVEDQEIPVFDCPMDIIVSAEAGTCAANVNFPDPDVSDNCPALSLSQTGGPISGSSFPVGNTLIEFTATDAAGNAAICTFNVVVVDDEDPEIICPGDIDISIPNGDCSTVLTYADPAISDNCPGVVFSVSSGPLSGETLTAGDYTVELLATDAAGNTAGCTFNVSISETSVPVFDCPEDLVVPADGNSCEAVVTFTLPTATDSCSTVTVTQTGGPTSGSVFPAGSTTLSFEAVDPYGNTAQCSYDVIVVDNENPQITCPANISTGTDSGTCTATVIYDAPEVSDNCGIASTLLIGGLGSGAAFPLGETTEIYELTDVSGNTATCSFTVTVTDNENPIISCPADILINLPDGECESIVNYVLPIADDNCGIASLEMTSGIASGGTFPTGTTIISYLATDNSGNTASCQFSVTVLESVAPEIICPADIFITAEPGLCGASVTYTPPVGTDDCPGAITGLTEGLGTGAFFNVGATVETYTVTDASGNQTSCSFTVTVTDDEAPVLECIESITVSVDAGTCGAVVNYDLAAVSDNCPGALVPVLSSGLPSGSVFPIGTSTITLEATDLSGNTGSCSFDITVIDDELPTISCPDDFTAMAASGDCVTEVSYPIPVGSDNCPGLIVSLVSGPASGEEFPIGITTVVYEAVDAAGNTASCSFEVTVMEDVPPTIDCPEDIEVNNDPGICGAIVNYTPPVGLDNCGMVSTELLSGPASGEVFPVGVTTVTYRATDFSGNQTECSFDVTVLDNEAPVFTCPADAVLEADSDNCSTVYEYTVPEATDNCTDNLEVTQTEGPPSGTALELGLHTFGFTTEDEFGNTAVCSYTVTVVDVLAPVFPDCPQDTLIALSPENCEVNFEFGIPEAIDNCTVTVEQSSGPNSGENLAPGSYIFEFLATDNSGNTTNCSFTATIVDTIAPVVTCPESFETCSSNPTFDAPTATDNCAIAELSQTGGPASGANFPVGISTIIFQAIDLSGNVSTCSFEIEVLQNAPRPDLGPDRNICDDTSITLNGSSQGNGLATWTLISGAGDIESPNNPQTVVNTLGTGENIFVYSLDPQNGCDIKSDTLSVIVEPGVNLEAGSDEVIFQGSSVGLSASATPQGGSFSWSPIEGLSCVDCSSPIASPQETTVYTVTYTTILGCEKSDSLTVRVVTKLPNTFTPDGDGTNDVWNIPGIEEFPNVQVLIYNRWGNEVFSSTGYDEPWDGTYKGEELPTGSYFYIIDYKSSGIENLNGTVNIIR